MPRVLSLSLLVACHGPDDEVVPSFPVGFVWGTAAAGFQVDPGCPTWSEEECVDGASDWYQWVTDPEIIATDALYVTGEPLSAGPGMWETFEQDADRMQDDGLGGFRLSIEWSRLFPDPAAEQATTVDELAALAEPASVARYHQMFGALVERGLRPSVTVNHYTLPLWVHDGVACHEDLATCERDGWVDGERIVPLIALYAGFVAREFGGDVDEWATLNEPLAGVLSGYLIPSASRSAPPGLSMVGDAAAAMLQNQIVAHAAMYDAIHTEDTADADGDGSVASVGLVLNMVAISPKDPTQDDDQLAAAHTDHLYHRVFLDGLTSGDWDDDLDGAFDRRRDDLAGRLDWIGINYYANIVVSGLPFSLVDEVPAFDAYPEITWIPDAEGLLAVLAEADAYSLPIRITENGLASEDQQARIDCLEDNLGALQSAIDGGADVRGYYYWSFIDNYEWNLGMDMRFGMYTFDATTKARSAQPIMERYREIVAANRL
jgi:beta-glucosidase/6-phospho-beta-glucosidase/beta-galactosidase